MSFSNTPSKLINFLTKDLDLIVSIATCPLSSDADGRESPAIEAIPAYLDKPEAPSEVSG